MEIRIIRSRYRDSWDCDSSCIRIINFFRGFSNDRKQKIDAHKSKVIAIFQKWNTDVTIEPSRIFEPSEYMLLDFYLSIVSQLKSLDPNGYALEHLKDSSYSNNLSLFNTIKEKESTHNTKVLVFYNELQSKLWKDLHQDTGLMESSFQYLRLVNDENIDEDTKKIYGLGYIDPNEGLHTENLLEYLLKRSIDQSMNEKDLVIKEGKTLWGLVYHTLSSRSYLSNDKNIAKSSFDTKKIDILRTILLSDRFIEISETLKELDNEVKEIQKLYSDFLASINKIVDKYPSINLKGKCEVEREFKFLK